MNTDDKNLEALRQAVKEVVHEELVEKLQPEMEKLRGAREELQEVKDKLEEVKESKSRAARNAP